MKPIIFVSLPSNRARAERERASVTEGLNNNQNLSIDRLLRGHEKHSPFSPSGWAETAESEFRRLGSPYFKRFDHQSNTMRIPVILLAWVEPLVYGFAPFQQRHVSLKAGNFHFGTPSISSRLSAEPSEEEEKEENPYQDPNYPDLEFVNYADPEYQVDQGIGDEFFDPSSTEAQVEAMREERRMRNDEFQFETYYKDVLKNGEE